MKTKTCFALRQVAGNWVVLPLAESTLDFSGMLTLNESGLMLWRLLEKGSTPEALAHALVEEYEVTFDQALVDVNEYIEKLNEAGCIDMQS